MYVHKMYMYMYTCMYMDKYMYLCISSLVSSYGSHATASKSAPIRITVAIFIRFLAVNNYICHSHST